MVVPQNPIDSSSLAYQLIDGRRLDDCQGMRLVFAGDAPQAYETGGTLKPTHAVTLHAILVLPALAWLVSFADWSEESRAESSPSDRSAISCW